MLIDKLGNKLIAGKMVMLTLPHGDQILCRVEDVNNGGLIGGLEGMRVPGTLMLLAMIPINFDPQHPQMMDIVVVETPSNQDRAQRSALVT